MPGSVSSNKLLPGKDFPASLPRDSLTKTFHPNVGANDKICCVQEGLDS